MRNKIVYRKRQVRALEFSKNDGDKPHHSVGWEQMVVETCIAGILGNVEAGWRDTAWRCERVMRAMTQTITRDMDADANIGGPGSVKPLYGRSW